MRHGQQDPAVAGPLDRLFSRGERLLMLAALEDGIRTILTATRRPVPQKRLEAELDWLTSDDPRPLFGFVSLCDFLGIDAAYLRERVLASRSLPHRSASTAHRRGPGAGRPHPRRGAHDPARDAGGIHALS